MSKVVVRTVIYKNNTKTGCPRGKRCYTSKELAKALDFVASKGYDLIRIDNRIDRV